MDRFADPSRPATLRGTVDTMTFVPDPGPTPRGTRGRPVAVLLAALLLGVAALAPASVEAASATMVPACSGVNVRTGPSTTASVKARLSTSTKVTTVALVTGTAWTTVCAGTKSGSTWYRISAVNGKAVRSLYGVSYLYAASGVLKGTSAAAAPPAAAVPPTATVPPTSTVPPTPDAYGAELMRLVNLDRAALGLPALPIDAGLASIARDAPFTCPTNPALVIRGRAQDMADRSYFAHTVAGCNLAGTTTPYPGLTIVRSVFGYALARSEILHWNKYGPAPTTYALGCDINGNACTGGTTTAPATVAIAQRNFMSSSPHRTSELGSFERFGCGSATVPGTTTTYFACIFSDSGSSWSPGTLPTATPTPTPAAPTPSPSPTPPVPPVAAPPGTQQMVPACSSVNIRAGASTTSAIVTTLGATDAVTVVATVPGSAWSTGCSAATAGSTWYVVSAVNGQPVSAAYGVAALFAATGVLAPTPAVGPTPAPGAPGTPPTTAPGTGPVTLGPSVTFYGRGTGHGVGLSQYGARGRALAGQDAPTILAHYYPGTTIGLMPPAPPIRVLLLSGAPFATDSPLIMFGRGGTWSIDGNPAVFPADARLRLIPPPAGAVTAWQMIVDDATGAILLNGPAPADLRVRGTTPATTLELPANSPPYDIFRGALHVFMAGANADVVNEVAIEDYLRGVVPAEMPASWPTAALTAQAIAARSYAAYQLRPGVSTFDVYDDTRSQVYLGVLAETPVIDAVIAATAGQVVLSGGQVVGALFHSADGGATENNENVFVSPTGARIASPVAALRGSPDRDPNGISYDATSPYATWQTLPYTPAQLSVILAADPRTNVGTLVALDLHDRGVSGRLISVTLVGSAGTRTVSGTVFIAAFNAGRPAGDPMMRSTLFDLAPIP